MSWGTDKHYRNRHKGVTANLTNAEYEQLKVVADCEGIAPSKLATKIIRGSLSERLQKLVELAGHK